jgi:hypothetical protein
VGGVISGYWAMGRLKSVSNPAMIMTMEITLANMGLSIKNRLNTDDLLLFYTGPGINVQTERAKDAEAQCREELYFSPRRGGLTKPRGKTGESGFKNIPNPGALSNFILNDGFR